MENENGTNIPPISRIETAQPVWEGLGGISSRSILDNYFWWLNMLIIPICIWQGKYARLIPFVKLITPLLPPSGHETVIYRNISKTEGGGRREWGVSSYLNEYYGVVPRHHLYHMPTMVFLTNPQFKRLLVNLLRREAAAVWESLFCLSGLIMVLC